MMAIVKSMLKQRITCVLLFPWMIVSITSCATSSDVPGPAKYAQLTSANLPSSKRGTDTEIELGKMLFFDLRLSSDKTLSCAICHDQEYGFADGLPLAKGLGGTILPRHTPHLYNLAWSTSFFWDGRSTTLEEQALQVILGPDEFNMSEQEVEARLKAIPFYVEAFQRTYPGSGVQISNVLKAIASFVRTLVAKDAPFDRYLAGDKSALTPAAVQGMNLFFGKVNCVRCHQGPHFTDNKFHNTGVSGKDPGRSKLDRTGEFITKPYPFFHTQRAFKTPGLRNVALTAPYMHNGSEKSLMEVLKFYNEGGRERASYGLSFDIKPLGLKNEELEYIVAFLESLTSPVKVDQPKMAVNPSPR